MILYLKKYIKFDFFLSPQRAFFISLAHMKKDDIKFCLQEAWKNRQSDINSAANLARKMLVEAEELKDDQCIADCHKLLGYCFWRFSDFSNSLEHSMKALRLYRELGDLRGEADALNNLGAVYMFHKNHDKRLDCNLKCLEIRKKIGNPDDISGSMNNIGETYLQMGNLTEAEKWFYDCINYPGATEDSIAWGFHNLGKVSFQNKDISQAIEMFNKSLDISIPLSYYILTTESLLELCTVHQANKNFEKGVIAANEALRIAESIGAKDEMKSAYLSLSKLSESQNKTELALDYFKKYHALHTEIFNDSNIQRIKDLEHRYEMDAIRKENEIAQLRNVELKNANNQIESQRRLLENKNKDIIDSIRYAKRIQQALLAEHNTLPSESINHFIYFNPKDIVSGDFYWINATENRLYLAVADCTGHGVPGGFLTMLGIAYLNEILSNAIEYTPAEVLNLLKDKFSQELKGTELNGEGMDISLCAIDLKPNSNYYTVEWAGANNPLWFITPESNGVINSLAPDKCPIGAGYDQAKFNNHQLNLPKGTILYLFSDGIVDQFGGPLGKKLKKSGLRSFIETNYEQPLLEQADRLTVFFNDWKRDNDQIDDVCVLGLSLS